MTGRAFLSTTAVCLMSGHDPSDLAIETRDLVKSYPTSAGHLPVLRGVSLAVRHGERLALLGRSGSGKSTLLNLVGALDRPTSGDISIFGRDLARMSSAERAAYRAASVGMIFQSYNLIPSRTALENVELAAMLAGRGPRERRSLAREALERVGLGGRLGHRPAQLSGGEQQRVAVARALINGPAILLADEPTGNLDSATAGEIGHLLTEAVAGRGMTLLLVTHDEELASRCADRVLQMRDGRIEPSPRTTAFPSP